MRKARAARHLAPFLSLVQFLSFSMQDGDKPTSIEDAFPAIGEPDNKLAGVTFMFDEVTAGALFDLLSPVIFVHASSETAPILRSVLFVLFL